MAASILVVDDESTTQDTLGVFLETEGYRVATVGSGEEALTRIKEQAFDVIVADVVMPGVSGLEVLERSRALNPGAAVILMTGHATVETAVEALRKRRLRLPAEAVQVARSRAVRSARSSGARTPTGRRGRTGSRLPRARSYSWARATACALVREQIGRCAATPSNVLITGESGTGKELVARAVHATSPRAPRPLVAVNCGAIPDSLLESQLFGHVRGAFTSAVHANPGLFVAAHGSTLFLDEIAELPVPLQAKLLRVLEEKQVWAVGATRPQPVDVRIIASTNRDLVGEIDAGRFRADLFYRLNVVHVTLPPLRERREDIPLLVDHCIRAAQPEAATGVPGHRARGPRRPGAPLLEGQRSGA